MTVGHLSRSASSSASSSSHGGKHRSEASYERELGERKCTEKRLRKALAQAKLLLRQQYELIRHQEVSSRPFTGIEDAATCVAGLSPRQRQIMELVVAGHPSKNIAADLGISQRTVENHRALIMKKTGSKSVPALVWSARSAAWSEVADFEDGLARQADSWNEAHDKTRTSER